MLSRVISWKSVILTYSSNYDRVSSQIWLSSSSLSMSSLPSFVLYLLHNAVAGKSCCSADTWRSSVRALIYLSFIRLHCIRIPLGVNHPTMGTEVTIKLYFTLGDIPWYIMIFVCHHLHCYIIIYHLPRVPLPSPVHTTCPMGPVSPS